MFRHPTAGVFVAGWTTITSGTGKKATTRSYWYVRRSQDGGRLGQPRTRFPSAVAAPPTGLAQMPPEIFTRWASPAASRWEQGIGLSAKAPMAESRGRPWTILPLV